MIQKIGLLMTEVNCLNKILVLLLFSIIVSSCKYFENEELNTSTQIDTCDLNFVIARSTFGSYCESCHQYDDAHKMEDIPTANELRLMERSRIRQMLMSEDHKGLFKKSLEIGECEKEMIMFFMEPDTLPRPMK